MSDVRPLLVGTSAELKEACAALATAERYYLDTEFETGGPQRGLCLIQISAGGPLVYLIDPLKLKALEPLTAVLNRPQAEWVTHAGSQDIAWIRSAMKIDAKPRIFDTQVGWGLLGPEYPVSLAYIQYRVLALRSAKTEQAGPWTNRPLTSEQIEYAASDVLHLPAIREWIRSRLGDAKNALVGEASAEAARPQGEEPLSLDDFRNAWQLDGPSQAALTFLIDWWNGLPPEERIEAPHPRVFLTLAKILPETGAELSQIRGIYFGWVKRHGDAFAGKLVRASSSGLKDGFVPLEPPVYNTFERILAGGWIRKAAADVCAEVGVAPDLAFPDRLIGKMVGLVEEKKSNAAAVEALTGWRATLLRERLLARSAAL